MIIKIPDNATRKEVHKLIFGIEPPELDSPYCMCACNCAECKHKEDSNCDVNWWNAPYKKNKQCGTCKYCKRSGSIFDVGSGYCTKTDEITRVNLWAYCCDEYEKGD